MPDPVLKDAPLTVLGIETSCDETAAAVVRRSPDGSGRMLSNIVRSQNFEHAAYGGVVPEIAARAHMDYLDAIVRKALKDAGIAPGSIDGIAVTAGPGLIGGLLVGLMTAKALAFALGKPFLAVNHLEGHALTPGLTEGLRPPYLLLLISGGHTQIQSVEAVGQYTRYGTTIDDALGEAFDKTAKLLSLGYPGGPALEAAARDGNEGRFAFPRPMFGREGCNFSFSGLKTAVRQAAASLARIEEADVRDICASFQAAVVEAVCDRVAGALHRFTDEHPRIEPVLVVSGGVAANDRLKAGLSDLCAHGGFRLVTPPAALCADNAAMIAWAGAERLAQGQTDALDVSARARWPLDPDAAPAPYAGVKA